MMLEPPVIGNKWKNWLDDRDDCEADDQLPDRIL
jgi:hypothetical protein